MPVDSLIPAKFDCDTDCHSDTVSLQNEEVIGAISSETARCVLTVLQESAQPVSKIADELDTSIQAVSYHIDRLESAGLVTIVATTYSKKGKQMDIYAPATNELIIKFDNSTERR